MKNYKYKDFTIVIRYDTDGQVYWGAVYYNGQLVDVTHNYQKTGGAEKEAMGIATRADKRRESITRR